MDNDCWFQLHQNLKWKEVNDPVGWDAVNEFDNFLETADITESPSRGGFFYLVIEEVYSRIDRIFTNEC